MNTIRLLLACLIGWIAPFSAFAQADVKLILQPEPRPLPAAVLVERDLRLELSSISIRQGGVALARLSGAGIESARFNFLNEDGQFFEIEGDAWYSILRANMDAQPRQAQFTVEIQRSGESIMLERDIEIESARYILQDFALPAERAYLADGAVEAAEFALLDEIIAPQSPQPLWGAAAFALPLNSETTSPFGAYRRLNERIETRHTGWDQRAPEGAPVRAMAAGRVAFADTLEIRGNYLLIDHGFGIYSGYAHLSQLLVNVGDALEAGQIIGMSGNTGRSSAPHLHWEVALRGIWVDGLTLIKNWLPA